MRVRKGRQDLNGEQVDGYVPTIREVGNVQFGSGLNSSEMCWNHDTYEKSVTNLTAEHCSLFSFVKVESSHRKEVHVLYRTIR